MQPAQVGIGRGTADVNTNRDMFTSEGWKIGVNPEYVRSLMRNYACVYAILMRGARLKGEEVEE